MILNFYDRDELFECSFLLLSILLQKYNEKEIDISTFKSHTQTKINYMLNNFHKINDGTQKTAVENLLSECTEINNTH
ncbi:hypothetical protein LY28_02080 [Ruminiclostridium sufflavum DSM 19573]|uniref:Uncharacterized protein n=1 Tax=Ruminiclostridium sufflavum DSM 19573 TaxID=1121337 RepID=A0A318XLV4_9FIRM|nr:hypothetical protein [Ruminiclostridium sufflavum]PYG87412.1 hypothetical protein LY28_02080 [Ruminiclostridium sufflavum DSM 19573]